MAENVFILGAGASNESGAPLMSDFLDRAEDLSREEAFAEPDKPKVEAIFRLLSDLQSIYAKSYLNLDNIEHVFGALELASIIGRLGAYTKKNIDDLREALVILIVRTLEKTIAFPVADKTRVTPTRSYQAFVDLVKHIGVEKVSVITFNYDIALDYALYRNDIQPDYCLGPAPRPSVRLLKLHGSINWARCLNPECDQIVPYDLEKHAQKHKFQPDFARDFSSVNIPISSRLSELKDFHKHDRFDSTPVIVPPTWSKTGYHGDLATIWCQGAAELGSARNIYVMGYSLPETDSFFRYLFALGTIGSTRIRRFWVLNKDKSGATEKRYNQLVGEGIRDRFAYHAWSFSEAIAELTRKGDYRAF